jgi:5-(carboxyamino)imidazole ribonucleotide mutase
LRPLTPRRSPLASAPGDIIRSLQEVNRVPDSPQPLVAILTGSPNDVPRVAKAQEALGELGVGSELRVLSAHRTPELTVSYVRDAEARGVQVFIACAGMANHLAGVVAAHTLRPVIGVPLASGPLSGFDALLSTVQMPPGVPVATVAVDGARNAGLLAARILALHDAPLAERLAVALAAERSRYSASEPPATS